MVIADSQVPEEQFAEPLPAKGQVGRALKAREASRGAGVAASQQASATGDEVSSSDEGTGARKGRRDAVVCRTLQVHFLLLPLSSFAACA